MKAIIMASSHNPLIWRALELPTKFEVIDYTKEEGAILSHLLETLSRSSDDTVVFNAQSVVNYLITLGARILVIDADKHSGVLKHEAQAHDIAVLYATPSTLFLNLGTIAGLEAAPETAVEQEDWQSKYAAGKKVMHLTGGPIMAVSRTYVDTNIDNGRKTVETRWYDTDSLNKRFCSGDFHPDELALVEDKPTTAPVPVADSTR